ncbi:MAG: enoyl-CoA hydratase/isomerase family protein, partial [Nocardioides sp.]
LLDMNARDVDAYVLMAKIMLTRRNYDALLHYADEALAIGLVDRVVPDEDVYSEALAWAGQFRTAAGLALRAAKECIDRGLGTDLETGLEIERMQFAAVFATEDRTTGMTSFLENGPGKATFASR